MPRRLLLASLLLWILACAGGPADSSAGRRASAWVEDVAAGNDADALAGLELPHDAPADFDAVKLGKRADRLRLLRDHDRVEWTRAEFRKSETWRDDDPLGSMVIRGIQRLNPMWDVEGVLWKGEESVDIAVQIHDGKVREVEVGGVRLIPRSNYHVVERPPPLPGPPVLRDLDLDWMEVGEAWFVQIRGELDMRNQGLGLLLTTTCWEGERFYRHATTRGEQAGPGPGSFSLSDRVGADGQRPDWCEVALEVSDGMDRRIGTWCLVDERFGVGPCPNQPPAGRTGDGPVTVDEVSVDLRGKGVTVHYTLHPNEEMPVRYNTFDSADLWTEVACAEGALDRHHRPLNRDEDQPGVHRRLGSVLITEDPALVPPCAIRLGYVRDDRYEREEFAAWEGCYADGALVPRPCP